MCDIPGCDGRHGWPVENRYGVACSVNENGHTDIIYDTVDADSPDNAMREYMRGRHNPDVVHGIVIHRDHPGSWAYTAEQIREIFGPAKKPTICAKCGGDSCFANDCIWEDHPSC